MEPIQPTFNEEYTTPACSTEMVNPQQTLILPIWITPLVQDIYEKFNFFQPIFDPPHASTTIGANARPPSQTIDHPINQTINPATTSK